MSKYDKAAYKEELGKRFKRLVNTILIRGYAESIGHIAKIMGQPSQAVSQMLHNERLPTLQQIEKLASTIGVNPNWLITGEEPMFLPENKEVDIIVMITDSMASGKIDVSKGEQIIRYIRQLQNEAEKREKEIKNLMSKRLS